MQRSNSVKTVLMIVMFIFLVIAGGCGGEDDENEVLPPTGPMLSNLQLSSGELAPDFSPTTMQYTVNVASSVTSITITPTTASANALISVNGVNVASGSASEAIILNEGDNYISIIVGNVTEATTYVMTVTRAFGPNYRKITPETAREMMTQSTGYIILDVRTEADYNIRRIPGAILIPHTEIEARAANELPNKNQLIFVYCGTGVRSEIASRALVGLGYTRVYDMGGINAWPYETISNP